VGDFAMKILFPVIFLSVFAGCASSQPQPCSSNNPEVCALEEQVAAIRRQQQS
jgi:hypothetical protein